MYSMMLLHYSDDSVGVQRAEDKSFDGGRTHGLSGIGSFSFSWHRWLCLVGLRDRRAPPLRA